MGVADWRHLSSFRHFCPFKADFCIDPSPNDNNAAGPATKARVCVCEYLFPPLAILPKKNSPRTQRPPGREKKLQVSSFSTGKSRTPLKVDRGLD